MKLHLSFFIVMIFISAALHAQVYTLETVPNPKEKYNGYVSNPDTTLSDSVVKKINSLLLHLENTTTDQVAVVVLNSIGDEVPKIFATKLFNKWGIGLEDVNNGLLFLVIMDQRRIEIETGYGMEHILSDEICKQILEYNNGVLAGVTVASKILLNQKK